jgi:hypothetical protein
MPRVHSSYTCPETGKEKKGTFYIASDTLVRAMKVKRQFHVIGKNVFVAPKPDAVLNKEKALIQWVCGLKPARSLKEVQEQIRRQMLKTSTTWIKASPEEETKYRAAVAQVRKVVQAYVLRQHEWRRKERRLALTQAINVLAANKCATVDQARAQIAELSTKL